MTSLSSFCQKFFFKYDQPVIRFRWLDQELAQKTGGITDLTISLKEFTNLSPGVSKVFVTENKVNGLSFPQVQGAMVIFGLGYGVEILKYTDWLHDKSIYYWGDIDTHGFAMLSRLRKIFPSTTSLLMDEATLLELPRFCRAFPYATFLSIVNLS